MICICPIYFFSYISALHLVLSEIHFNSVSGSFTLCKLSPLVFCKIAFWLSSFQWSPSWSVFHSLAVELVRGFSFLFRKLENFFLSRLLQADSSSSSSVFLASLLHFMALCAGLLEPHLGLREWELDDGADCLHDRLLQMFTHSSFKEKRNRGIGWLLRKSISDGGLGEKGSELGHWGSGFSLGLRKSMIKWREGKAYGEDLFGQVTKNQWQFSPVRCSVLSDLWWWGTRLLIVEISICWIVL